jgi:hypothetical protein
MLKTFLITVGLMLLVGNAMARSQIIIMPDGSQMVCYYYNDGRIVQCEKL